MWCSIWTKTATVSPCLLCKIISRRSSKGLFILLVKLLNFLIFAVYGIWQDLGAWKILLRDMPMICLQFWGFSKMSPNREASTFFSAAGFCLKQCKQINLPAKAPPSWIFGLYTLNDAHKQYGLLDTIFNYICILDLQENHYKLQPTTRRPASLADMYWVLGT